jgi:2-methylcitrate dehydratase PrpD
MPMTAESQGVSQRLAAWVVTAPRTWTAQGAAMARLAVQDSLICAISGAGDLEPILDALDPVPVGCPVPGRRDLRVLPDAAALAWGTAFHKRELDDQTYSMGGHLMCVTLAALIGTRYGRAVAWEGLYDAITIACEVASRLNLCLTRKHMEAGWVATTTYGLIAATCALARIEKFSVAETLAALSMAGAKAFGAKNIFGTPAKAVNPGLAARDAVMLARLARAGLAASVDPLEGPFGFGQMYRGSAAPDWSQLVPEAEGGVPLIATGMAFKKYACCASAHRCIDALLALRAEHGFTAQDVDSVIARVGPLNALTLRYPDPKTPSEALFSMPYSLASALRFGSIGPADFSARALADPDTRALLPRIRMALVPEALVEGFVETVPLAHCVEVTLKHSSTRFCKSVLYPKGAPQNPFTADDWREKFHHCTDGILSSDHARTLATSLNALETVSLTDIVNLVSQFDSPYDPMGTRFRRAP